jgi:hypothetical protein
MATEQDRHNLSLSKFIMAINREGFSKEIGGVKEGRCRGG